MLQPLATDVLVVRQLLEPDAQETHRFVTIDVEQDADLLEGMFDVTDALFDNVLDDSFEDLLEDVLEDPDIVAVMDFDGPDVDFEVLVPADEVVTVFAVILQPRATEVLVVRQLLDPEAIVLQDTQRLVTIDVEQVDDLLGDVLDVVFDGDKEIIGHELGAAVVVVFGVILHPLTTDVLVVRQLLEPDVMVAQETQKFVTIDVEEQEDDVLEDRCNELPSWPWSSFTSREIIRHELAIEVVIVLPVVLQPLPTDVLVVRQLLEPDVMVAQETQKFVTIDVEEQEDDVLEDRCNELPSWPWSSFKSRVMLGHELAIEVVIVLPVVLHPLATEVGYQQVGVEPDGVAERVAEWVDAERVEVEGVEAEVEAEGVADQVWAEG
ncbi:MAG: hypothetical protein LQ343_006592 [Gyalolechia ehrenbergii]|nr:MAG: hypothetical protein LQ343_006592 [Gyalolechia ehrenbergii]